jgi:RNA polymerase sigma-70 factor (ECF subfamily)
LKVSPQSLSLGMATHNQTRAAAPTAAGTAASFAQIYREQTDFVWRNARRLGIPASSADDVVQDVFIVVQRRLGDFDGRVAIRSWIFGILVHVVRLYNRGHQRKEGRCVSLDQGSSQHAVGAAPGLNPSEEAERAERMRLLETLLSQLSEDQRLLLVLSELEEWTLREIAAHLGSNINTVFSRLRAAKLAFNKLHRRWLAERGERP